MADNRYRDERGYGSQRRDSIFSDDDRSSARGHEEDRGFFEKAGDEVRSWFGGDDGRERDERMSGSERSRPSHYGSDHGRGGFQGDYRGGSGQGGFGGQGDWSGGRESFSGDSSNYRGSGSSGMGGQRLSADQHDHYRSWRDRQIGQLDRDYEDYCREREQQFHQDFSSWRQARQSQGSGMGTSASSGSSGSANLSGSSGGGTEGTSGSAGEASGMTSDAESDRPKADASTSGGGRSGSRTRS